MKRWAKRIAVGLGGLLVLAIVFGASAIADRRDVIPAAVTAGLNISRRIRDVERLSGFRVSG